MKRSSKSQPPDADAALLPTIAWRHEENITAWIN